MNTGRILLFFLCIYTTVVLYLITIRVHHILTVHSERTEREQVPVPRVCVQNDTKQENVEIKIREAPALVYLQPAQFGPGSYGEPVEFDGLLTENDTKLIEQFHRIYDYNAFISDLIPFPRLLPDYRPSECRKINYPENLPKVSVIIPFRNERLSVLLRTIHNILFYTPEHLLEEIIIVDDASTEIELTFKLDLHVQSLSKVVLIRKATNVGLMMARQAGIDISKADYFICMDSHIEVSLGWVEPILNRLVEKPKALVYSNIGSIDNENFEVKMNRGQFGVPFDFPFFAWNFEQEQSRHSEAYKLSRTNKTDPILMGSAMGMMICMKKSWFYQLGGFDPGMKIWGSEQIEISVKVWMCGGVVEMIPCSFVAHIYRRIVWNLRHVGHTNKVRLIETWVDEPYKQIIYNYNGFKPESVDYGDISERLKVREQNQCKSFQYFLDKIREFANIHIPLESHKLGTWRNVQTNMCLDRNGRQEFPIQYPCHDPAASQYFEYTIEDTIRHLGHCLYVNNEDNIVFKHCDHFGDASPKKWRYNETEETFVHISTGKCMTADLNSNKIVGRDCTSSNEQKWRWESK